MIELQECGTLKLSAFQLIAIGEKQESAEFCQTLSDRGRKWRESRRVSLHPTAPVEAYHVPWAGAYCTFSVIDHSVWVLCPGRAA